MLDSLSSTISLLNLIRLIKLIMVCLNLYFFIDLFIEHASISISSPIINLHYRIFLEKGQNMALNSSKYKFNKTGSAQRWDIAWFLTQMAYRNDSKEKKKRNHQQYSYRKSFCQESICFLH